MRWKVRYVVIFMMEGTQTEIEVSKLAFRNLLMFLFFSCYDYDAIFISW